MIRVAIVDDETRNLEYNESLVKDICTKLKISAVINKYNKAQNLLYDINEKIYFDICLLDIEMPEINGLELARLINEKISNNYTIFITSHNEYAIMGYELHVFRYIPKILIGEKLPKAIKTIYNELNKNDNKCYTIKGNYRYEKLFYKDIIYIFKEKKNSIFVTFNGESSIRKGIAEVFSELDSKEFIVIDRGCIVNLKHITKFISNEVIMVTGKRLTISRSNVKEVKRKINEYWRTNE